MSMRPTPKPFSPALLVSLLVLLLVPSTAVADTVLPSADSYVSSAAPTANYGSSTSLKVDASPTVRSYLRFHVSVPAGATVTSAKLRVHALTAPTSTGIRVFDVADDSWGESSISHITAPPLGVQIGSSGGWSTTGYKEISLPPSRVVGGANSFAITTASTSSKSFNSRTTPYPPQLVVTYRLNEVGSAYDNIGGVGATVGPEETAWGPSYLVDSPFTTTKVGSTLRGFVANRKTQAFESAGSVFAFSPLGLLPGMGPGSPNTYDECGAWLTSAEARDSNFLRGWYHAERMGGTGTCDYNVDKPLKSVAYAESSDGGRSWTKRGQVLTNPNSSWSADQTRSTGEGDHSVVRVGDSYLMYFNPTSPWGVSVAKSPTSSGGVPGSWKKWHNGAFSSPGLGGSSSVLSGITGTNVKKIATGSGELVAVSNNMQAISGTSGGVYLSFSKDGINWRKLATPLVTIPPDWQIGYASLQDAGGSETLGKQFVLYYMKRSRSTGARYLMRRQVDLGVSG